MNIKYRILSIDEDEAAFVVRYFTDIITEEELCNHFDIDGDIIYNSNGYPEKCRTDYNMTINNVSDATEENIHRMLVLSAPLDWLKLKENIKNNNKISLVNVSSILTKTVSVDLNEYKKLHDPIPIEKDENFIKAISNVVNSIINSNI